MNDDNKEARIFFHLVIVFRRRRRRRWRWRRWRHQLSDEEESHSFSQKKRKAAETKIERETLMSSLQVTAPQKDEEEYF